MQPRTIRLICAIACLAVAIPVFAQYGHPLKGSWSGDWWVVKGKETHVLLDFNWDGKVLTGTLNPGPDQSPMKNLSLNPPDVLNAGKAAIAARDAALAKQAADAAAAAANPAPAAGAATAPAASAGTASKTTPPAATAGTAPKTAAAGTATKTATPAAGRGATTPAVKDNIAIATDPWILHFEADTKDAAGKTVHVTVDGKMENLGAAYTRVITGKWQEGTQTGSFKVIRN
ncbi:MAG TPA: hypothetical protein VK210_09565 [Terriglobia bacterium]|nr:hypothetical protein [Terriglobia bacterium]